MQNNHTRLGTSINCIAKGTLGCSCLNVEAQAYRVMLGETDDYMTGQADLVRDEYRSYLKRDTGLLERRGTRLTRVCQEKLLITLQDKHTSPGTSTDCMEEETLGRMNVEAQGLSGWFRGN